MKQLFPYIGSKSRLLGRLIPSFPAHSLYVSVFGGSGVDFLLKEPSRLEIYNDLDAHLCNLFSVLQTQRGKLVARIKATPARSRRVFEKAWGSLDTGSALSRAWAFLVVAHQGYRTRHPALLGKGGFGALLKGHSSLNDWRDLPDTIDLVGERFACVQQENLCFRELIPRYDGAGTFFFLDPPYWGSAFYPNGFSEEDHVDLCQLLLQLKGYALLCGYSNPVYERLLSGWNCFRYPTRVNSGRRSARVETVWFNYGARLMAKKSDLGRGKKECPSCKKVIGSAAKTCKHCGHTFTKTGGPKAASTSSIAPDPAAPAASAFPYGAEAVAAPADVQSLLGLIGDVEEFGLGFETWAEAKEQVEAVNSLINKVGFAELLAIIEHLAAKE